MKALGWVCLLAIDIPVQVYNGWTVSLLWGWFIVPLGAPSIGVLHAIGICVTLKLATAPLRADHNYPADANVLVIMAQQLSLSLVFTSAALMTGFIVQGLMP